MKTLQEKIDVMQAFDRGEKIEYRHHTFDAWVPAPIPSWNWSEHDYRIAKPEPVKPREFMIVCDHKGKPCYAEELHGGADHRLRTLKTIRVREVVDVPAADVAKALVGRDIPQPIRQFRQFRYLRSASMREQYSDDGGKTWLDGPSPEQVMRDAQMHDNARWPRK